MSFTNYTPPLLNSEQAGAMPDLIAKMLHGYTQQQRAKYLPKQIESDIFNKQISPLATLATTPTFMNDQQFQENLRNLISTQFPNLGGGAGGQGSSSPTYAGQAQIDATRALGLAKELKKAGGLNLRLSQGAGWLSKEGGGLGDALVNALSGGKINSSLANKKHELETVLSSMHNYLVQTHRLSPARANEVFAEHKDEDLVSKVSRIIRDNPQLFTNSTSQESAPSAAPEQQSNLPAEINETNLPDTTPNGAEMLLIAPDGSKGWVPADKANQLIASGKFKEAR